MSVKYRSLSGAKRARKAYSLAIVARNGRSREAAVAWLERNAEESKRQEATFMETGNVAASQLDFRRQPIGPKAPEPASWFAKASKARGDANACYDAVQVVWMRPEEMQERLDEAVRQINEFLAAEDAKKGQGSMWEMMA